MSEDIQDQPATSVLLGDYRLMSEPGQDQSGLVQNSKTTQLIQRLMRLMRNRVHRVHGFIPLGFEQVFAVDVVFHSKS